MKRYQLILDSNDNIVTLAEAQNYLKVDNDDDNYLINSLIVAARKFAERYCNRSFVNQRWRGSFDYTDFSQARDFYLPYGDIQSINSVTFFTDTNEGNIVDSANYRFLGDRFVFNTNYMFPVYSSYRIQDTMIIEWTAGYGALGSNVPEAIKQGILMLIEHWYSNRGVVFKDIGNVAPTGVLPLGAQALLDSFRIYEV